jgi:hypothetical protein
MSEPQEQAHKTKQGTQNDRHEGLDAETIIEDAKSFFEPDNHMVPSPQPDASPG